MSSNSEIYSFRARAHLLSLLGDELIGNDRLAVFELVKNAYDADATKVTVTIGDIASGDPYIQVEDNGVGMDIDTIKASWLEIATDYKRIETGRFSPERNRHTLGEKGIGRLAVHKLSNKVCLVTRKENNVEYEINIDWSALIDKAKYIEDTRVAISSREKPEVFQREKRGTRITLSDLRRKEWSRGDVRRLKRMITTLISPFEADVADFDVQLVVPGLEHWLEDILDVNAIKSRALWHYKFKLENGKYTWHYNFIPASELHLQNNLLASDSDSLALTKPDDVEALPQKNNPDKLTADSDIQNGIGVIEGEFYVFDRRQDILKMFTESKLFRSYLDEQAGIRIYRDGIRVYNYGEPDDDWLGLDLARVQHPGKGLSRNVVIGAIRLKLAESKGLKEKTNREGFYETDAFFRFKRIVKSVIEHINLTRQDDREAVDQAIGKSRRIEKPGFSDSIQELKSRVKKQGLEKELGSAIDRVEKDYENMRDIMINSGISGLNLSMIFHEVERGVRGLNDAISRGEQITLLNKRASQLVKLLDGFSTLLKRGTKKRWSMTQILQRLNELHEGRFKYHNIYFSCPLLTGEAEDFEIDCSFGLLVGAISNLIDNSIYWTRRSREESGEGKKARIFITTSLNDFDGAALIIADNGDGFKAPPEVLTQPFKSLKPEGMGLGLYYTSMVMELHGGKMLFPERKDVELPEGMNGAVIALEFRGKK